MELFLIEIPVVDWPALVSWYQDTLGLNLVLRDDPGRFALFQAGPARIALKQRDHAEPQPGFRLIFHVEDLEAERNRLLSLGVPVSAPLDNLTEGYREARLHDPEGTPIALFTWLP